ncbi:PAS domain-containing protein [Sphingomonas abietis]|uniref:PAS domain-containing protein n=1 Tax=Sphingomonas abietis TaxID=3012344 RepID=UPI00389B03DA
MAWTADAIGGLLEVDERGLELTGLSFDRLRGGSFLAVVHPDDRGVQSGRILHGIGRGHSIGRATAIGGSATAVRSR